MGRQPTPCGARGIDGLPRLLQPASIWKGVRVNAGGGVTGYLHPEYARSLSHLGTPIRLEDSGGWLIERGIPGTGHRDAMGCYPLFCCTQWEGLRSDLEGLCDHLVSVVLVADPFGDYDPLLLKRIFDVAYPYKLHFAVETGASLPSFVRGSHQAHARRALRRVEVELCAEPLELLDDCERLLSVLAERHALGSGHRLSRDALRRQLAVPGLLMFRATLNGRSVGIDSWYVQGDRAYGHLAAFDWDGYALRASYATKWTALEYFNDRVRWINLGSGLSTGADDGLAMFKRGWANTTRQAWLCGRVLQPDEFNDLARPFPSETYFPPYRKDERAGVVQAGSETKAVGGI